MRKTLAASIVLGAVLMSGCSQGSADETPPNEPPSPTTSTTPAPPERTAPAKSLNIADQCSIISPEQAAELGVDAAPFPRDSNGVPGCSYEKKGASGFSVFVAADKSKTMQKYAETKTTAETVKLGAYPAAKTGRKDKQTLLVLDVSDHGSLQVNAYIPTGNPGIDNLATKFAEAALKNLPNA